ncbi:MAG: hypothetical protein LBG52_04215 [Candidatus Peribacteria bacterium]|jgi:hypothetical protein|nr:hypothetical protein [Candidatus Peribacteria bacterium]
MTGDKVISVIELSPRFFSEVDIDPMEVLCTLIDTGLVEVRKSVSNEELIESLEAEQIDVPVGATRGEIVVLCVENQLSPE